jgi:hypothetical protein
MGRPTKQTQSHRIMVRRKRSGRLAGPETFVHLCCAFPRRHRRDLGLPRGFPSKDFLSLAARSTPDGFPANPNLFRRQSFRTKCPNGQRADPGAPATSAPLASSFAGSASNTPAGSWPRPRPRSPRLLWPRAFATRVISPESSSG